MKRASAFLLGVVLAGCSPSQPPVPVVPKLEVKTAPVTEEPSMPPVAKVEPPKVEPFRYTNDAGGKVVEKSLQPKLPPAGEARTTAPRSRDSDVERGELTLPKPMITATTIPPTLRKPTLPPPPKEGIPERLGVGHELALTNRPLSVTSAVRSAPRPVPTATDVPRSATQIPERASLEDPTHEISTARIVNTSMIAPNIAAPILRLILPNPFEFAEQMKFPAAAEFATSPVVVPSAKP